MKCLNLTKYSIVIFLLISNLLLVTNGRKLRTKSFDKDTYEQFKADLIKNLNDLPRSINMVSTDVFEKFEKEISRVIKMLNEISSKITLLDDKKFMEKLKTKIIDMVYRVDSSEPSIYRTWDLTKEEITEKMKLLDSTFEFKIIDFNFN